ncbi:MAG TPA: hypothetical protein V6C65_32330 [Allocoleopsis sp.]
MFNNLLWLVYWLNAAIVALVLLLAFLADRTTPKSQKMSWAIILVASVFWFIAVPLSGVEYLRRLFRRYRVTRRHAKPSQTFS